jgi:hypothetical protein
MSAPLLQIHVVLSLIGIVTGLLVFYGLLTRKSFASWTAIFLVSTALTSLTGFPLAPLGFDPARAIGIISLALLAVATVALYAFHAAGAWRWIYVSSALAALYLNVFVGVVQSFQKLSFLQPLAPTQSETPFIVVQLGVLLAFVIFGVLAVLRFHPAAPQMGKRGAA